MRFLAGLRLVLVAAALIGLFLGPTVVAPMDAAHAAMTKTMVNAGHDCCGKTSNTTPDKAGLAGQCLGTGCFLAATALLPSTPGIDFLPARTIGEPIVTADLKGRSPAPPLEPPRA